MKNFRKKARPLKPTSVEIDAMREKHYEEERANKPQRTRKGSKYRPDSIIIVSDVRKGRKPKRSAIHNLRGTGPAVSIHAEPVNLSKIAFGDTLPGCTTVDDVGRWLGGTKERAVSKAIGALQRRTLAEETRDTAISLLTRPETTSACILTNPRLMTDAFEHLHKCLVSVVEADPNVEMALVTLIAGDCETSTDRPVIDLYRAQRRARATLRAMSKNFIAVTDLVMFNSIPHADGGVTMNHHEHAVVFGNLRGIDQIARKHSGRYPANCTGARPIDVRHITDLSSVNLARIAAYLLKVPAKAINFRPGEDGKGPFINHSEKGDRMIRYLRMEQIRSLIGFEEVFYAAGDGKLLRRKVLDVMRALVKSDLSPRASALHPDAIASFWVDFAKEIRRDKWALPVIKRRS